MNSVLKFEINVEVYGAPGPSDIHEVETRLRVALDDRGELPVQFAPWRYGSPRAFTIGLRETLSGVSR